MKNEKLMKAIGKIDDDLIYNAVDAIPKKKKRAWVKWVAAAACLCVVAAAVLPIIGHFNDPYDDNYPEPTVDENGVTIPKMKFSLLANQSADMLAFFIYKGNLYIHNEWIDDGTNIVGEYLGTATGLIDEWTPKDGYVEFAGSVKGDFYEVKGYDESFMLCMKHDGTLVSTYVCSSGITLKYGSELYEDRLHLSEGFRNVSYETRGSWYYDKGEVCTLGESEMPAAEEFVRGLDQAEFMLWSSVPEIEGHTQSSIFDTEIYHLYFEMEDGTTVHLRLYENGYVRYQGLLDVCVQMPLESYESFVDLLGD